MNLTDRIVEMAVVHPGDKLIINVPNNMPLDPYSSERPQEQLEHFAHEMKKRLGDGVDVLVFAGNLEITVIRAGAS